MIICSEDKIRDYLPKHKDMEKIFLFLSNSSEETPIGNSVLVLNKIVARVFERNSKDDADLSPQFESHKEFIDLHVILKGFEILEAVPLQSDMLSIRPYCQINDVLKYESSEFNKKMFKVKETTKLEKNIFCILFPSDVHRTYCSKNCSIKKIVFKIHKDYF